MLSFAIASNIYWEQYGELNISRYLVEIALM